MELPPPSPGDPDSTPPDQGPDARRWWIAGAVAFGLATTLIVVGAWSGPSDTIGEASTSSTTTIAVTTSAEPAAPMSTEAAESTGVTTSSSPPPRTTTSVPATTTTLGPLDPGPPATAPPQDEENPSIVVRPIPDPDPPPPPPAPPPPWAASTYTTGAGHISTDVGCVSDRGPLALNSFFAARVGPVLGWDYQHVYPLGGSRYLWLFQDAFIDHSGTAGDLGRSGFAHNAALVQDGNCFRLLHRGTTSRPQPFEEGNGSSTLSTWYWPMGGEVHNGRLYVFWARMVKDAVDPAPPDGLGWHPSETWIGVYDPATLSRLDFRRAPNSGAAPIYGYAVASDATHTYLFGNTFEQNLSREGGFWNGPHSGTRMYLARVPRGELLAAPEYRTADGWSDNPAASRPIVQRYWAEFPMQPRVIDGEWVAVAAVNGYWGEEYTVDVANQPWGPWTTSAFGPLIPRGGDPKMNAYHAHLLPWRDAAGNLIVSVSNNARNMFRDAWPFPHRYRPMTFTAPWVLPPPPTTTTLPPTTTTSTTTTTTTTSTTSTTTTTTTTVPPTTTTPTTTTTVPPTTSTTSTTVPPTSTSTTTTTSVPPTSTTTTTTSPPRPAR